MKKLLMISFMSILTLSKTAYAEYKMVSECFITKCTPFGSSAQFPAEDNLFCQNDKLIKVLQYKGEDENLKNTGKVAVYHPDEGNDIYFEDASVKYVEGENSNTYVVENLYKWGTRILITEGSNTTAKYSVIGQWTPGEAPNGVKMTAMCVTISREFF